MIPLHRVVLMWDNGCRLEIFSNSGEEGEVIHLPTPVSEATREMHPSSSFTPKMCWREDGEKLFESLQLREETEYIISVLIPLPLDEAKRRYKDEKHDNPAWPFMNARLKHSFRPHPPQLWHASEKRTRIDGHINFRSYVGIANLSLLDEEAPIKVEVACSKLDYFEDFVALLEDIAEHVTELLFQVDSATGIALTASDESSNSIAMLFHLRRLMASQELPAAVASILRSPISRLETVDYATPTALARNVDPANLVARIGHSSFQPAGPLGSLFGGYTPQTLIENRKHDSIDVVENRFVKDVIRQIEAACEQLVEKLSTENPNQNASSLREASSWLSTCREWLDESLWREVGDLTFFPSNSQVLQKRDGYKEVLNAWIILQMGLQLPWPEAHSFADGIEGDVRPIYQLYEFWCFFALRRILRDLCGDENAPSNDTEAFLRTDLGRLEINLKPKNTSFLKFDYFVDDRHFKIQLWYHRKFKSKTGFVDWNGSYSGDFNPDYSISIVTPNKVIHWLHFDAKYKLSFSKWQAEITDEVQHLEDDAELELVSVKGEGRGDFNRADLFKMHSYRDAILGSRGAYVLFPGQGDENEVFVRHASPEYRREVSIPSAGAFPLRPQGSQSQTDNLKVFISNILNTLTKSQDYQEESGVVFEFPSINKSSRLL